MADPPRVRKNVDEISDEELANYKHALKRLYEISAADPDSIDGYTYFEQLHDGDTGPCEHANDTFLPWHRAHLYLFEEALRRSDPPRTQNVTIPYWDWSALPSGQRYAKAFEENGSPLRHARNSKRICRAVGDTNCDRLPFPRSHLESEILSISLWASPPTAKSEPSFGGYAGGESNCKSPFGEGFGSLEEPAHNSMHGGLIGGDMADPSSASLDPIFWSFHAYFDLLLWQWQQMDGHSVDTGLESRLCGLFKDREHLPENRFRVKDVLNVESQLGYTYAYSGHIPAPMKDQAEKLFATHPAVDLVLSGRREPDVLRSIDVVVPAADFNQARLNFTGVQVRTPFSYGADIYLAPESEKFTPRETAFREKYLVDFIYIWKAHEHGGHGGHHDHDVQVTTHDMVVDVTKQLRSLSRVQGGQKWKVWVALASQSDETEPSDRSMIQPELEVASKIDFDEVKLEIR